MNGLKIAIILLFLICCFAAGHSGGPFVLVEIALLVNIQSNGIKENTILMGIIASQITWWVAIRQSYDKLMLALVIFLSLIVIAVTIISKDFLSIVIWTNSTFLIVCGVYLIRYFKNLNEAKIGETEEI
jgi:Ca2+/Na+ antiporter